MATRRRLACSSARRLTARSWARRSACSRWFSSARAAVVHTESSRAPSSRTIGSWISAATTWPPRTTSVTAWCPRSVRPLDRLAVDVDPAAVGEPEHQLQVRILERAAQRCPGALGVGAPLQRHDQLGHGSALGQPRVQQAGQEAQRQRHEQQREQVEGDVAAGVGERQPADAGHHDHARAVHRQQHPAAGRRGAAPALGGDHDRDRDQHQADRQRDRVERRGDGVLVVDQQDVRGRPLVGVAVQRGAG